MQPLDVLARLLSELLLRSIVLAYFVGLLFVPFVSFLVWLAAKIVLRQVRGERLRWLELQRPGGGETLGLSGAPDAFRR